MTPLFYKRERFGKCKFRRIFLWHLPEIMCLPGTPHSLPQKRRWLFTIRGQSWTGIIIILLKLLDIQLNSALHLIKNVILTSQKLTKLLNILPKTLDVSVIIIGNEYRQKYLKQS